MVGGMNEAFRWSWLQRPRRRVSSSAARRGAVAVVRGAGLPMAARSLTAARRFPAAGGCWLKLRVWMRRILVDFGWRIPRAEVLLLVVMTKKLEGGGGVGVGV